jgi:3-deoxy-D-manno-octulosonic-acid transferase
MLWALFLSPKIIIDLIFYKKYRGTLLYRLGIKRKKFPQKKAGEYRIWIHAVSLGESKAAFELVQKIQAENKHVTFYFSTATETGQNEVKKKLPFVKTFFLPIDFSWTMKKLTREICPDLFILVETDYWMNLLTELKNNLVKIVLVNGKLSVKSFERYKLFHGFANRIFSPIDRFCLQTEDDLNRFSSLGIQKNKLLITGNLKFDTKVSLCQTKDLFFPIGKTLLLASTHEREEEMLLDALKGIQAIKDSTIMIAPRHPERFDSVEKLLMKRGERFRKIDERINENAKVVLVNRMGIMEMCYREADLIIMGGSFIKSVGGHNIFEPLIHDKEVVFGPHMHKQKELVLALKKYQVGHQIELNELKYKLEYLLKKPANTSRIRLLKNEFQGSTDRCLKIIKEYL